MKVRISNSRIAEHVFRLAIPTAGVVKAKAHPNTPVRDGASTCTGTGLCSFAGEGDFNDLNAGGGGGLIEISGTYSVAANRIRLLEL